jgi:hypothetical protein
VKNNVQSLFYLILFPFFDNVFISLLLRLLLTFLSLLNSVFISFSCSHSSPLPLIIFVYFIPVYDKLRRKLSLFFTHREAESCSAELCLPVNWLLLRSGIVKSVPQNCYHFIMCCASRLSSNHSWFIHQISLLWLQQRHLVAKRGEAWREMSVNFACIFVHTRRDL